MKTRFVFLACLISFSAFADTQIPIFKLEKDEITSYIISTLSADEEAQVSEQTYGELAGLQPILNEEFLFNQILDDISESSGGSFSSLQPAIRAGIGPRSEEWKLLKKLTKQAVYSQQKKWVQILIPFAAFKSNLAFRKLLDMQPNAAIAFLAEYEMNKETRLRSQQLPPVGLKNNWVELSSPNHSLLNPLLGPSIGMSFDKNLRLFQRDLFTADHVKTLLQLISKNPDKIFTKQELMDALWASLSAKQISEYKRLYVETENKLVRLFSKHHSAGGVNAFVSLFEDQNIPKKNRILQSLSDLGFKISVLSVADSKGDECAALNIENGSN